MMGNFSVIFLIFPELMWQNDIICQISAATISHAHSFVQVPPQLGCQGSQKDIQWKSILDGPVVLLDIQWTMLPVDVYWPCCLGGTGQQLDTIWPQLDCQWTKIGWKLGEKSTGSPLESCRTYGGIKYSPKTGGHPWCLVPPWLCV